MENKKLLIDTISSMTDAELRLEDLKMVYDGLSLEAIGVEPLVEGCVRYGVQLVRIHRLLTTPVEAVDETEVVNVNELLVYSKNVYGNQFIYPVCKKSRIFAELTNKKTLSKTDMVKIERLGYTFEFTLDPALGDMTKKR